MIKLSGIDAYNNLQHSIRILASDIWNRSTAYYIDALQFFNSAAYM